MRFALILAAFGPCFAQQGAVRCRVIEAGSGTPLAGAHVRLMAARKGDRPDLVFGAETGRDGYFSVDPIAAGTYMVSLDKTGYLGQRSRGGIPTESVAIKTGERQESCRFEMTRRSAISGRVVDANGDPVGGVPIRLLTPAGEAAEWIGTPIAVLTDSRGLFRVSPAAGRYRLKADPRDSDDDMPETRSDGTSDIVYGPTVYPSVIDAAPNGELSGIEIRLQPWQAGSVSGTVTGIEPGAKGRVLMEGMVNRGESWGDVEVAADGSFTFPRLRAGSYKLFAETDGFAQSAVVEFDLGDTSVTGIRLAIRKPFDVSGTVEMPAGSPAQSIRLERAGGAADVARIYRSLRTAYEGPVAADRTFRIERVSPGKYRVRVLPAVEGSYVAAPAGILDLDDAAGTKLRVVVRKGAAQISGTIENESGPVTHGLATAFLWPDGAARESTQTVAPATDGTYRFTDVAPGRYRILGVDPVMGVPPDTWEKAEPIEVKENDRLVRKLKAPLAK
jgi:hypothetical protein